MKKIPQSEETRKMIRQVIVHGTAGGGDPTRMGDAYEAWLTRFCIKSYASHNLLTHRPDLQAGRSKFLKKCRQITGQAPLVPGRLFCLGNQEAPRGLDNVGSLVQARYVVG